MLKRIYSAHYFLWFRHSCFDLTKVIDESNKTWKQFREQNKLMFTEQISMKYWFRYDSRHKFTQHSTLLTASNAHMLIRTCTSVRVCVCTYRVFVKLWQSNDFNLCCSVNWMLLLFLSFFSLSLLSSFATRHFCFSLQCVIEQCLESNVHSV